MCNKSDSIVNLAKALVAFNLEVKIIEKDAKNPHFKNDYATLDNIVDEVRPLLAKHGLVIMQFPGGDGEKYTLRTMLVHESGEWIESEPLTMRPVKNDPQGIGSCTTYARRYSLTAMLSLNTGEDDDGEGASRGNGPVPAPAAPYVAPKPSTNTNTPSSTSTPAAGLISTAQVSYCHKLKHDKGIDEDDFRRMVMEIGGRESIKELTKKEASEFINLLNNYQKGA
ncbi:ERF family protein [Paenibacillus rhizophilus]|uniref:Recombinase n=1 Tax=Paenibacillus rhizophilus TaxID=1850366 RepID=A0A3N9P3R9_9BACL|nr:ERF family protein [Paenibacillus rhizophilus]RQW10389.1 recombinase [Paenibacillus rhizophilus]